MYLAAAGARALTQDAQIFDTLEGARISPRAASVGFLALDRNRDGIVNDGSELFGTATVNGDGTRAVNGFEALRDVDGNGDGKLDPLDPVYSALRLWLDSNHNGRSESTELLSLNAAGITAIFTSYREKRFVDHNGNEYRLEGRALVAETADKDQQRRVFDVFFKVQH